MKQTLSPVHSKTPARTPVTPAASPARSRLVWSGIIRAGVASLLLALIVALPGSRVAAKADASKKLDKALKTLMTGSQTGDVPVIIRFKEGADDNIDEKLAKRKKPAKQHFPDIRTVTTDLNASDLQALADESDVETLSLDADVRTFATPYSLRATLGLIADNSPQAREG